MSSVFPEYMDPVSGAQDDNRVFSLIEKDPFYRCREGIINGFGRGPRLLTASLSVACSSGRKPTASFQMSAQILQNAWHLPEKLGSCPGGWTTLSWMKLLSQFFQGNLCCDHGLSQSLLGVFVQVFPGGHSIRYPAQDIHVQSCFSETTPGFHHLKGYSEPVGIPIAHWIMKIPGGDLSKNIIALRSLAEKVKLFTFQFPTQDHMGQHWRLFLKQEISSLVVAFYQELCEVCPLGYA